MLASKSSIECCWDWGNSIARPNPEKRGEPELVISDLLSSVGVGLVGGVTSGLLGVSPGGGLVVFSNLLLGSEQHVAQGISLVAQIPPASVSGMKRYWEKGSQSPIRWLILLSIGFLAGGVAGAFAAGGVSGAALRWTYVFYLAALDAMLILRRQSQPSEEIARNYSGYLHWAPLLVVGVVAGISSGFLGIGGGLAITVGLSAGLRVPRHQAQLVSLVISIIPTTIPAAWVYWHQGWSVSWLVIGGVVLGLWGGTDLGARMASRVSKATLHHTLVGFVSAMAIYMAYKALT
jgi:uncharacterized protein